MQTNQCQHKDNDDTDELQELKDKMGVVSQISLIHRRKRINRVFKVSWMTLIASLASYVSFTITGEYTLFFKLMSALCVFNLIIIHVLLFIILYEDPAVAICMNCRRIKAGEKYYVLEEFIGMISHDICPSCSDSRYSVGAIERKRSDEGL
jgi:hypothetical protein